jgi:hypothetical protein
VVGGLVKQQGRRAAEESLREVACAERVPAEKRAMNSLSCAIFFSRCAFCDSRRERTWVLAITMSS